MEIGGTMFLFPSRQIVLGNRRVSEQLHQASGGEENVSGHGLQPQGVQRERSRQKGGALDHSDFSRRHSFTPGTIP